MTKPKILIVEDEAIIAMEVESQLQSLGYEVTSIVDTGEKAIEKADIDKPDLMLMDIRIKGEMDGIDTAEIIRTEFGIPVIFSTAYLDHERIQRAKITMPFGYVLKPIQERDLRVTLEMGLYVAKMDAERKKNEQLNRMLMDSLPHPAMLIKKNRTILASNKFAQELGVIVGTKCWKTFGRALYIQESNKQLLNEGMEPINPQCHFCLANESIEEKCLMNDPEVVTSGVFDTYWIHVEDDIFLHYAVDISEQKQAEVALKDSEKQRRAWLENSPDCTKILDLDFNLQYMSSAGVRSLKVDDVTPFYGKPYPFNFYPDSFKVPMHKNLVKAKETGEIIMQEAPVVDVDGNEIWFHSTIVPINDDEGKLDYLMVVSIDTTERKQAEETLKESEEWFSTTLRSIGDAVITTDTNGNVTLLNPVAELLTGWKQEEATGKPLREIFNIINESTREPVENPVEKVLKTGNIIGLANHTVLIAKDGREIPIDDSGSPIKKDNGEIFGVVLVFRDISRDK